MQHENESRVVIGPSLTHPEMQSCDFNRVTPADTLNTKAPLLGSVIGTSSFLLWDTNLRLFCRLPFHITNLGFLLPNRSSKLMIFQKIVLLKF
jgi:hypothetical protein